MSITADPRTWPEPLFRFSMGSSSGPRGREGASVRCLRCGELVAAGRYAKDVYPKAEGHVCPVPSGRSGGGG